MLPTRQWLSSRNLQPATGTRRPRLSAEALTYALVTYAVRPSQLPEAVLVLLAEQCFARMALVDA